MPVILALSQQELGLVEEGLECLLRDVELEAGARVRSAPGAEAASRLLARLKQAEALPPGPRDESRIRN
jgi:hypothetical protein